MSMLGGLTSPPDKTVGPSMVQPQQQDLPKGDPSRNDSLRGNHVQETGALDPYQELPDFDDEATSDNPIFDAGVEDGTIVEDVMNVRSPSRESVHKRSPSRESNRSESVTSQGSRSKESRREQSRTSLSESDSESRSRPRHRSTPRSPPMLKFQERKVRNDKGSKDKGRDDRGKEKGRKRDRDYGKGKSGDKKGKCKDTLSKNVRKGFSKGFSSGKSDKGFSTGKSDKGFSTGKTEKGKSGQPNPLDPAPGSYPQGRKIYDEFGNVVSRGPDGEYKIKLIKKIIAMRNIFAREIYEWVVCDFQSQAIKDIYGENFQSLLQDPRFERLKIAIEGINQTIRAAKWAEGSGIMNPDQVGQFERWRVTTDDGNTDYLAFYSSLDRRYFADSETYGDAGARSMQNVSVRHSADYDARWRDYSMVPTKEPRRYFINSSKFRNLDAIAMKPPPGSLSDLFLQGKVDYQNLERSTGGILLDSGIFKSNDHLKNHLESWTREMQPYRGCYLSQDLEDVRPGTYPLPPEETLQKASWCRVLRPAQFLEGHNNKSFLGEVVEDDDRHPSEGVNPSHIVRKRWAPSLANEVLCFCLPNIYEAPETGDLPFAAQYRCDPLGYYQPEGTYTGLYPGFSQKDVEEAIPSLMEVEKGFPPKETPKEEPQSEPSLDVPSSSAMEVEEVEDLQPESEKKRVKVSSSGNPFENLMSTLSAADQETMRKAYDAVLGRQQNETDNMEVDETSKTNSIPTGGLKSPISSKESQTPDQKYENYLKGKGCRVAAATTYAEQALKDVVMPNHYYARAKQEALNKGKSPMCWTPDTPLGKGNSSKEFNEEKGKSFQDFKGKKGKSSKDFPDTKGKSSKDCSSEKGKSSKNFPGEKGKSSKDFPGKDHKGKSSKSGKGSLPDSKGGSGKQTPKGKDFPSKGKKAGLLAVAQRKSEVVDDDIDFGSEADRQRFESFPSEEQLNESFRIHKGLAVHFQVTIDHVMSRWCWACNSFYPKPCFSQGQWAYGKHPPGDAVCGFCQDNKSSRYNRDDFPTPISPGDRAWYKEFTPHVFDSSSYMGR